MGYIKEFPEQNRNDYEEFYHITIMSSDDSGNATTQHFLSKYTQDEYDELADDDECIDWEEIFRCNIQIDTCGMNLDMDAEIITQEEYNILKKQNGSWTWVT